MRAILIDPRTREVTEHDDFPGGLDAIYHALGCDTIDAARLGGGVVGYIDDEGLLKPNHFFALPNDDGRGGIGFTPFAGPMLLVGTDDEGGDAPLPEAIRLGTVRALVQWMEPEEVLLFAMDGRFDGSVSDLDGCNVVRIPGPVPQPLGWEG